MNTFIYDKICVVVYEWACYDDFLWFYAKAAEAGVLI